jgi:4-amino-4-deoxy-L-arabinose transferase-like glycosyltransferase
VAPVTELMTNEGIPHSAPGIGRGIGVIVALFLLLSNVYGLVTPIFEASDEIFHYPYVQYLAVEHRLPVQDPDDVGPWKQEGGQPPLYYLIAAAATSWIDTRDLPERLVYNPHAQIGIPLSPDNKNMVVHTPAEGFPFKGTVLAVHLIRLLSTLMGAGTVLLTYLIVREVFPGAEVLALAAAAVTAFNPMFLFISASVNNDNLAGLLCSLALWQMLRMVRTGASLRRVIGVAIVIGLAALSKLSALGLIGLIAVVLTWDAWRQRSLALWLRHGLLSAGVVAVLAGWWYVRNWVLYRDPLGFSAWLAIAGGRPATPGVARLLAEFEGFRISYWGLFGGVNVLMHPLMYRFYDALALLAVVGLLLAGARWIAQRRKGPSPRAAGHDVAVRSVLMVVLGLWPLILGAALVRWTGLTEASQGRLIFPGVAAVSFWLAVGWSRLIPRPSQAIVLSVVGTALLFLAALAPWAFIAPAYAAPPAVPTLPDTLQPLNITYDQQVELVGYRLPNREVLPGQTLAVELGWRSLAPMEENYSVFVHLYGPGGEFLGQFDTYPGGGLRPTSLWSPGDQLLDTVYVPVTRRAQAPLVGRVVVGLYRFQNKAMLLARDPNGIDLGTSPTIGKFKAAAFQPKAYDFPQEADYLVGQSLTLVGYDLSAAPSEVTLYWQAVEPVAVDYTVFVHLLDSVGQQVAQADGQPQADEYPTSWWSSGEVVADHHVLPPDAIAGLPAGEYTFSIGLYSLETGVRLPVSMDGAPHGDQIILGPITVP